MLNSLLISGLTASALAHAFLFIMLPSLGRELGLSDIEAGAVLSVAAFLQMLVTPVWGHMSERWGRRPVLLLGFATAAVFPAVFAGIVWLRAADLMGPALFFYALLAARAGQALLGGGTMPAAQALIADVTNTAGRAGGMGMLGASFGLGTILAGALTWRLGGQHPVLTMLLIASLAFAALLATVWKLPETRPVDRPADVVRDGKAGDVLKRIWPCLLVTLLGLSVYSLLQQVTALRLQDAFGLTQEASLARAGMTMMLTMAAMVVTQGLVVRKLRWLPARLLVAGAGVALLGIAAATLADTIAWFVAATVVLGIGLGLMLPGNLASLSFRAGPAHQGRAAGFNGLVQGLALGIGPMAGATLHQLSATAPYLFATALIVAALLVVLLRLATARNAAGTFAE